MTPARHDPVAITGLGCICAAGRDLPSSVASMFDVLPQPKPPVRFTSDHPTAYPVFEVGDVEETEDGLRTSALGVHAAREALADAGLDRDALRGLTVGVCVGTTVGCVLSEERFCRECQSGSDPDTTRLLRRLQMNPADTIARAFGLTGPRQAIVNACSSGTDAIGVAGSWIRAGVCDAVIAGGADELGRIAYIGFISLMITDDEPCKPFDVNRKGLNLGEGAAMLVLESEAVRRRRGRQARSFLLGYGSAADAYHPTTPRPDGAGLTRAIIEALACSGDRAQDVAFVNAHGTGTPDNDRVEARVLAQVLPGIPYLSTKGQTGHTLGAEGAIEAALTSAFLNLGKVPASAGFVTPDPAIPNLPVQGVIPVSGPLALSQSLAFGGCNSVVSIGKGEGAR